MGFLSPLCRTDCTRSGAPLGLNLDHSGRLVEAGAGAQFDSWLLYDYAISTMAVICTLRSLDFLNVDAAVGVGCFDLRIDCNNRLSHSALVRIHTDIYSILYTPLLYRKHEANYESRDFRFSREPVQPYFTSNWESVATPATPLERTVNRKPLRLLATLHLDRQEPPWSTQVLERLRAVSLISPTRVTSADVGAVPHSSPSQDPSAAVLAWLHSVDDALSNDLTPPATSPIPPPFCVPQTAVHSRGMPSPGN